MPEVAVRRQLELAASGYVALPPRRVRADPAIDGRSEVAALLSLSQLSIDQAETRMALVPVLLDTASALHRTPRMRSRQFEIL
jgi:hypothetical protein